MAENPGHLLCRWSLTTDSDTVSKAGMYQNRNAFLTTAVNAPQPGRFFDSRFSMGEEDRYIPASGAAAAMGADKFRHLTNNFCSGGLDDVRPPMGRTRE